MHYRQRSLTAGRGEGGVCAGAFLFSEPADDGDAVLGGSL